MSDDLLQVKTVSAYSKDAEGCCDMCLSSSSTLRRQAAELLILIVVNDYGAVPVALLYCTSL